MATTGMRANCPRCKTNSWISNAVTDEVKKGLLKCMECGYLAKEYDIEYCFAPRYIYTELIEVRKEIELLKEQLEGKKETYRLTRKDVLEIVRDELSKQPIYYGGEFEIRNIAKDECVRMINTAIDGILRR